MAHWRSPSTQGGYDSAEGKLVEVIEHVNLTERFNHRHVTKDFFDTVGKFLMDAKTSAGNTYAPGTILKYLSGIFLILKKRYPNLPLWKEDLVITRSLDSVPLWYRTLRLGVEASLITDLMKDGKKLTVKALPIGEKVATTLGVALLQRNTAESVCLASVNTSCHMNGGRTTEITLSSHDLMAFSVEDEVAKIDWNQIKVGTSKEIYYYANVKGNFVLCWYHSLMRQWLADPDLNFAREDNDVPWMYPVLSYASNPTYVVNNYLIEILPAGFTGTGYRSGAINRVAEGPSLTTVHQVAISGHDFKNICSVFEYTLSSGNIVRQACKWFAGAHPNSKVVSPRLVFLESLSEVEKNKFMRFVNYIVPIEDYRIGNRLWGITQIAIRGLCIFRIFAVSFQWITFV